MLVFEQTQFFLLASSLPLTLASLTPSPAPRPPASLYPPPSAPAKSSSLSGRKCGSGSGWSRKGQGQERALLVSPIPHTRVRGLARQEAACDTRAPSPSFPSAWPQGVGALSLAPFTHRSLRGWSGENKSSGRRTSYRRCAAPCGC